MKHKKTVNTIQLHIRDETIAIEGPISSDCLATLTFHQELVTFREAEQQQQALIELTKRPETRMLIARDNETVIGYVIFTYPDPLEHWSKAQLANLLELGAIEVIPKYRGFSIGKHLLQAAMMDEAIEEYIVIATLYYWHWDLKGTGKTIWEYRKIMENLMNAGGLVKIATDEPDIQSHPANCLMVRFGKLVDPQAMAAFHRIRFSN